MLQLKSILKKELTKLQIQRICKLKGSHWAYNYKSQLSFFKKKVKQCDINNLVIKNKTIIGYTLLRLKIDKNKNKFILFDTLIIDKKYRKKNYSYILMQFNNFIIKYLKLKAYLICNINLINFYKNHGWKLKKNKLKIKKYVMYLNV